MQSVQRLILTLILVSASAWLPAAQAEQAPTKAPAAVSNVGIMPVRGMTMAQVEARFGPPQKKFPAVGKPPISRWRYDGFMVYFEDQYVIHAKMSAE